MEQYKPLSDEEIAAIQKHLDKGGTTDCFDRLMIQAERANRLAEEVRKVIEPLPDHADVIDALAAYQCGGE